MHLSALPPCRLLPGVGGPVFPAIHVDRLHSRNEYGIRQGVVMDYGSLKVPPLRFHALLGPSFMVQGVLKDLGLEVSSLLTCRYPNLL